MKKRLMLMAAVLIVLLGVTARADVILPAGLTEIGDEAFENNQSLSGHIEIPYGVTCIPAYAFANCPNVTSVTIPDSVTTIEQFAFINCKRLTAVTIPASVEEVGIRAFLGCEALETLTVEGKTCFKTMAMTYTPWLTAQAQAVADAVTHAGQSDFEKALALHDWITENSEYDRTVTYFAPENLFLYHTGVCNAYMKAYTLLLTAVGIESKEVTGTANGGLHGWNLVKLDGEWYHVDCTWDDPLTDGWERHDYFCVPDDIMREDHIWNAADYPAATGTKYYQGR